MSFNDILEAVEKLPRDDQVELVDILRRRQIEKRRTEIAAARREHRAGKRPGG